MPRKGKDFSPQQKAALTRKYERVKEYIDKTGDIKKSQVSFIKYPKNVRNKKLRKIDAVRTDKGIIYKYPDAELKIDRKTRRAKLVIKPKARGATLTQQRYDVLHIFPDNVKNDPNAIKEYIEHLRERERPEDIRWSTVGKRESPRYDAKYFDHYIQLWEYSEPDEIPQDMYDEFDAQGTPLDDDAVYRARKVRETMDARPEYYNGVFFVYYDGDRPPARKSKKAQNTQKRKVRKTKKKTKPKTKK